MASLAFVLVVVGGTSRVEADEVWSVPKPDEPDDASSKSRTSGLSLGAGVGYQTPIFGAQVTYDVRFVDARVSLVPWMGIGRWADFQLGSSDPGHWHTGYAGGMMAKYGDHHRLVVDLAYAPARFESSATTSCGPNGCTSDSSGSILYAVTGAVGYEYLASGGFFVRPMIGANSVGPTAQLSVGAKLW